MSFPSKIQLYLWTYYRGQVILVYRYS